MTKEEIKALIASKIEGQGSAVDAGSALPQILNEIVDSIGEGGGSGGSGVGFLNIPNDLLNLASHAPFYTNSKAEFAEFLGVSEDEVDGLMDWQYPILGLSLGRGFEMSFTTKRRPYDGQDLQTGVEIEVQLSGGDDYYVGFGRNSEGRYTFECRLPGNEPLV